ncbi:hypothetical protein [Candidatus Nanohalobium constans]|uniref:Uncharacterized protein n=1 Tax=Candidatus Nanohalobium constans TaxID=2565781 RepID=A0A5Q0UG65_9ARCH|nr:hypothetical protein [Candidatus Nanohalobium constans]QGA79979.1 hypothetical protein LC1Nh_0071 [Candidatus Nanohalobium constans]
MASDQYRSRDEVDERVRTGAREYEAIHGERPPTNPNEAVSTKNSSPTEHPVESIMDDAEIGVAALLDSEPEDERIVADGGFEYQLGYESADDVERLQQKAANYEDLDVQEHGDGVIVRGPHSEVREFRSEYRQSFGALDPDKKRDMRSKKVAADGSGLRTTMRDVDHGGSEEVQSVMERGSDYTAPDVVGTSMGSYEDEGEATEVVDPEGVMGM